MQSHTCICIAYLSRMRNNIATKLWRYKIKIYFRCRRNRLIAGARGGKVTKNRRTSHGSDHLLPTSDFFYYIGHAAVTQLSLCVFLWNIFSVPSWRVRLRFTLFTPMYSTSLEHTCNKWVIKEWKTYAPAKRVDVLLWTPRRFACYPRRMLVFTHTHLYILYIYICINNHFNYLLSTRSYLSHKARTII